MLRIRWLVATVIALACACAFPALADATTVGSVSGTTLTLTSGPEDNNIALNGSSGSSAVYVSDTAGVTAGAGCTVDPNYPTTGMFCGDITTTTALVANLGDGTNTFKETYGGFGTSAITSIEVDGGAGPDDISFGSDNFTQHTVNAGAGNDTVSCNVCSGQATIDGGAGDDNLYGGPDLNVVIHGGDGNDTINGGTTSFYDVGGNEQLFGDAGNDTITEGYDSNGTIDGGSGNDTIHTSQGSTDTINVDDGEADIVNCNLSTDVVNADPLDVVSGCTKVNVDKPPPTQCPAGETGTPPNCTKPPATTVSLSLPGHQKPVKSKKLLATVACSAACYMGAYAEVKIGHAKPFEVDSNVFHLGGAGHKQIALVFSKKQLAKLKAALKAHKKIVASITGELTNASGAADYGETHALSLTIKS